MQQQAAVLACLGVEQAAGRGAGICQGQVSLFQQDAGLGVHGQRL